MLGAGLAKIPDATAEWLKIAPIVSGSYTEEEDRPGNDGVVMHPQGFEEFLELGAGYNAYGMPNMGYKKAAGAMRQMKYDQPMIVSIAGFSVEEYITGVQTFAQIDTVSAIELNFGCSNTQGEHATIISFDPETINTIVHRVMQLGHSIPIWVKLSPYSNPQGLQRVAKVLNQFVGKGTFQLAVVTCNTFPMAYVGENTITAQGGFAGLSGPVMKSIALGQVRQFRQHLSPLIDVIGVGGVMKANDIVDFLDAGASAVQVTSLAHWAGDPRSFMDHFFAEGAADRFFEIMETKTKGGS